MEALRCHYRKMGIVLAIGSALLASACSAIDKDNLNPPKSVTTTAPEQPRRPLLIEEVKHGLKGGTYYYSDGPYEYGHRTILMYCANHTLVKMTELSFTGIPEENSDFRAATEYWDNDPACRNGVYNPSDNSLPDRISPVPQPSSI